MDAGSVGAFEAKTKLGHLLDRVEKGERITITRHGVPVAELCPIKNQIDREKVSRSIEALKEFRKKHVVHAISLEELKGVCSNITGGLRGHWPASDV